MTRSNRTHSTPTTPSSEASGVRRQASGLPNQAADPTHRLRPGSPEQSLPPRRPEGQPDARRPTPEAPPDRGVLRLLTCGSVDDGKSTLIGRLLFDSKAILADTYEALARTSAKRGRAAVDLSLLTDGLQAEREQGITIDVAYRYFSTGTRSFILADAPGHAQYTRNMVTAASTADLAILLVDARKGLLEQTRRHLALAHALGLRHLVVAVNKMDLVGYEEAVFRRIEAEVSAFAEGLGAGSSGGGDLRFLPLSALTGDNVVARGANLPWYAGPTLLELLESAKPEGPRLARPFRMAVQGVLRPHQDFRAYTGRIASGRVAPGDAVAVLPSGRAARVKALWLGERALPEAVAGQSVALELEEEVDVSRGDLLAAAEAAPLPQAELEAELCWLGEAPLEPGRPYLLRHGTRETRARLSGGPRRLDLASLERHPAKTLRLNELGSVRLRLQHPLPVEPYALDRALGAFILVDEASHGTVAAGLVR